MARKARTGDCSAIDLRKMHRFDVTTRYNPQIPQNAAHLQYKKMVVAPALLAKHGEDCMD